MLSFQKLSLPGIPLKPDSVLPAMRSALETRITTALEEDDGLFVGYGMEVNALPFTMQDCYGTEYVPMTFDTVVLENDFLKATFIPKLGGRLWSLFDKVAKRDLLTNNPVFKPQNFAIRNAWVAGGVEWNIGRRGHHDLTCSPLFTATTTDDDGTPVLRFYEFCRSRAVSYQMDFWLPENSHYLLVRVRIMNDNRTVVPMYWWSNIAVPERKGQRIIVPAKNSFANSFVADTIHGLTKVPLPVDGPIDITVPTNYPFSKDQFFNIPPAARKFEASIYEDGYGLIQTSTDRLQGRKLFVWGQGAGGHHWQRCLTNDTAEDYLEIQGGICKTQTECMPMPPETAWEWMEAYGPIQTKPEKVFGNWDDAVSEVATTLEGSLPRQFLDDELARTRKSFALKPAKRIYDGAGWGALEGIRADKQIKLAKHLDYGQIAPEQEDWLFLLKNGFMPQRDPALPPPSYMVQDEWFNLLKAAVAGADNANWHTLLQLGINYFYRFDYERAEQLFLKSLAIATTPWGLYALANVYRMTKRPHEATMTFAKAVSLRNNDETLAKEAFKCFIDVQDYARLVAFYDLLSPELKAIPMCKLLYAKALVKVCRIDEAEAILLEGDGLRVPDIREGENSTSEIYIAIQIAKAAREGKTITAKDVKVPAVFDYRMS